MAKLLIALALAQTALGGVGERYAHDERLAPPSRSPDWADEFAGNRVDAARWSFDTSRNKTGWFNHERQYYGPGFAQVHAGRLTIGARRDAALSRQPDWGGQAYGSAKLTTMGHASWTYGFVEVRAKLPCGGGMWPAIWMMPDAALPWPDGGEIDIMEQVSSHPNLVHATLHTAKFTHSKGTQRGAERLVKDSCTAFHRYQMRWTPREITIGLDGRSYFQVVNDGSGDRGAWPFDTPFHLILNLAVGGDWPGPVDDRALPQRMDVDYVRVWHDR